jgi:acetate---CoA ligase (ADP-forming)
VIRAASLEELVDVASLLSTVPEPRGRSVAVLTNAGGLGILCADACEAAGLELPPLADETVASLRAMLPAEASVENPVDMLGGATAATYAQALPVVLADPRVDALVVLFAPTVSATSEEVAAAVARAAREIGTDKPVLGVAMSAAGIPAAFREAGRRVAAFTYPESAARALGRAAERADWLRRPQGTVPELDDIHRDTARAVLERSLAVEEDAWLPPGEARALLDAYGLPLVPERLAPDAEGAAEAARDLGLPVVVKTAAPGAHKTELGGIALDLATEEEVRAAAARIGGPVIVQPMVRGGAELLAGVVQDPVFGPLVAFGPGGVLAELIGEAAFRIAPLTDADAEELVASGKAGVLVRGFRGAPPADAAALAELVLRLARLGDDLPEVAELDLNPVIARPDGCLVVDARVRVQRPQPTRRTKSW